MPSGRVVVVGVHARPIDPHRSWLPAPLRVAVDVQKIGMEFFFFFFPQGGPNRIRSGAKIGVFFCQGCQSRRSDPTRQEFVEKRCYFFSPGKIFGKNADITAINDGFLSVFCERRLFLMQCTFCGDDLSKKTLHEDYKHIKVPGFEELGELDMCNECYHTVNPEQHFGESSEYGWEVRDLLRGDEMTFEQAWDVVKMPVYHGTTAQRAESIMRDGLKPQSKAPQLYENYWEDIQEALGLDDQKMEEFFGGDWNFFYGDKAKPSLESMGGRESAISNAFDWMDGQYESGKRGGGGPVVLEIDDQHPDSPFFMPEMRLRPDEPGFNEQKDQRRSSKVIPPHLIRQLGQDEVDRAVQSEEGYFTANDDRANLMDELVNRMARSGMVGPREYLDEEFDHALDQKGKIFNFLSRNNLYHREGPPYWEEKGEIPQFGGMEGME